MKRSGDPWVVDGSIVALALLGLGIVVRLIMQPVFIAQQAPAVTVAVVVEGANEVRRRAAGGFEWRPLESGDALAAGELVFVGPASYVHLSMNDNTVLAIDENSLVRMPEVKKAEDRAELTLVKGSVDVQSQSGEVTVTRGKTKLRLGADSRARLSASGTGAEVELKKGGADLGLGGALEAGTRTLLDEQGTTTSTQKLSVKQLAPNDGDRFFATDEDPRATFSWDSPSADCELVLKGREARRVRASASSVSLVMEAGFYSWRVECRAVAGIVSSETRWLVVQQRKAPRLLAPRDGSVVNLSHAKDLFLSWTRAPGAARYAVTLESDEPGMPEDQKRAESQRPRARLPVPPREGRYCSQVRAVYPDGPESPWSPRECFRVVTRPVLQAPTLFAPKREKIEEPPKKKDKGTWLWQLFGGVAYAAEQTSDSAITLRWGALPGAKGYLLEIADDRAFTHIVLKQKVEKNYFRWFKIARRNYYMRVRAVDDSGREGVVSETQTIGNETEAPVPISPGKRQVVYSDTPEITLRWSATEAVVSFSVAVARDADFNQIVARADSKKREVAVKLPAYGEYHWRVVGTDLEGQQTKASNALNFIIANGTPDLLSPKPQEHFAKNEAELSWSKRAVGAYEIELTGTDGNAERLTISGTSLTMRPGSGAWTWRVRGKKPDTAWSEKRTFWIDEEKAASKPSSTPASQPVSQPVIVQQIERKLPPAPTTGSRVLLGVRLGFFSNFGAVDTVRPGIDVSARWALGPGELGAVLAADYYPASMRLVSSGYTLQSSLNAINVSLGAVYALHTRSRFRPYLALGGQVLPGIVNAQLNGTTVASQTVISWGGFLAPGCELALGPGALFLEVMLALASRPKTAQVEINGSGIFVGVGYRFSLLSSGKLQP